MDKDTIEKMAVQAYENLSNHRVGLFIAVEDTLTAKELLEQQRGSATIAGVFDGKNAEIREAQAREHLKDEYEKLANAEKAERRARYEFDRASLDMENVKTLLRIAELP